VAVVALGGYGRQLLLPGSDVDLMVLHAERGSERIRGAAERLFYPFWDAGFSLGHAVRTVDECLAGARERVDVACSLIDARLVWGEQGAVRHLAEGLAGALGRGSAAFAGRLRADVSARQQRYASCSMDLEPNLKEGSGGLRDVHVVAWTARVAGARHLRAAEAAALDEAEEFLVRLRSALHLETGKRADRLFLEHQPALAAAFGFEATAGLGATDALMRSLFEHARQVEHIRDLVLERAAGPSAERTVRPAPGSPEDVVAAFADAVRSGARPLPSWLDALDAADLGPTPYAWTEDTRAAFLEILAAADRGATALEAMDRAGVLVRFLPEWEAVRCRPQRDPYHRSTVDVHLVRTAAGVARLLAGGSAEDPVLRVAAAAVEDRAALLLGALFHDIGKTGEGRHVEVGARVAADALDRMGVTGGTREDALFLVEHHLLLSNTAVRRDLADENLVLDVAARVGDPRRLAMLYVLTVADAEATGPHAHTPWRMALLRELVAKAQHVLEVGAMGTDRAALLRQRLEAIREHLAAEDPGAVDRYLERLPRAYVMAVSPATAAAHLRLVGPPLGAAEVRTAAFPGERTRTYELSVVAADRPGLLARIAGSLALGGFNILSAQAFTTEDGVAVDLFVVEPAFRGEVEEDRWRRVRHSLRRALEGRISLEYRVREKRRHYPPPAAGVDTEVRVLNDASDFSTVVEVETADRIGLLFDLARTFEELALDVHLAKVATYGARVVDAFYVRDLYGRKVEDPEHVREVERAVVARLAEPG
jgi:[protein-PII] uridylyltransferase